MQEIKKNEDYLVNLRKNLEEKYQNQEIVNLKLKEIYAEGFSVKVEKLFTFLHYNYMAWQYPDLRYWKYVAPFLIDRTFRCQITNYQKDTGQFTIDARISTCAEKPFVVGRRYNSMILAVEDDGFIIDIGYAHQWRYGSKLLSISRNVLESLPFDYTTKQAGDTILLIYKGINMLNNFVFEGKQSFLTIIESHALYLDRIYDAEVINIQNGTVEFLINNIYSGFLSLESRYYPNNFDDLIDACNELKISDFILVETIGVSKQNNNLMVRWWSEDGAYKTINKEQIL